MLFSKKDPEKEARKEYAHYIGHIEDHLIHTVGSSDLNTALSSDAHERMKCDNHLISSFGTDDLVDVFTEFSSDEVWEKFVERVNTQKRNYANRYNKIYITKEMREKTR
ncbi:hypothetical protein [Pectinatus frisingensis]|uniref:hypothetical protein n=1 Tax=Pectinatus frisingensis TaxID=865 RepID=UPI0018C69228|nr:hypothetical protein [Pectinatus frisingensis]